MFGIALYTLLLVALGFQLPAEWWDASSPSYLFLIGGVALWRYGWGGVNLARAHIYLHFVFPKLRRKMEAMGSAGMPAHTYLLITSFRIDTETSRRAYAAAVDEAIASGLRCTIVASIVEMADQRLIKRIFELKQPDPRLVDLVFVRIGGSGKRDALAEGFRVIARDNPTSDDAVCVIDGDSLLEPGILRKSLPFLKFEGVGAFTTDEVCEVVGAQIFREWYSMRFAQRQILMCSHGLARKVLTLTGRMSAFRADIVADPDFIRRVEQDYIDHWRLGRVKFLTGDDKSSWYHLLIRGWKMMYIPDVRVITIETPPNDSFAIASVQLMVRWFGNMLRTNGRALALGPSRIGLWTWWSIFDQRISMWTSLTGLFASILMGIFVDPVLIIGYFYWALCSRLILTFTLLSVRESVDWRYPFLLYYNQIVGSLIKTYIVYRMNRQKWTRQDNKGSGTKSQFKVIYDENSSRLVHIFSILLFVSVIGSYIGALNPASFINFDLMSSE